MTLFYPNLNRREAYQRKSDGHYYSDYKRYRLEIEEDSNHRCGYCDAKLGEVGGEGLQLDHFRPQACFPALKNNPTNLVLACAGCNRLKSNTWPPKTSRLSFIDPFQSSRSALVLVENSGLIVSRADRLFEYQLHVLDLNRPSRISIRRHRLEAERANRLIDKVVQILNSMELRFDNGQVSAAQQIELRKKRDRCKQLLGELKEIVGLLSH